MSRGERRNRTENVKRRRVREWHAIARTPASRKRVGAARKVSPFACSCSGHRGLCHASPKAHRPLVERRANRFATDVGGLTFDRTEWLWLDCDAVGDIEPMIEDRGYQSDDGCWCCCCTGECSVYTSTWDAPNFQYLHDVIG